MENEVRIKEGGKKKGNNFEVEGDGLAGKVRRHYLSRLGFQFLVLAFDFVWVLSFEFSMGLIQIGLSYGSIGADLPSD